jgi:hypothetical protein
VFCLVSIKTRLKPNFEVNCIAWALGGGKRHSHDLLDACHLVGLEPFDYR